MFIDWTVPLIIGVVGGPLAILVKFWYKKKGTDQGKFADNGTYVRDDSLYSYDEPKPADKADLDKNNS
ncbi:MAG TPA: hypothetical protein VJ792_06705 [Candidatus Nitrosotalea sp.]|nr:hypothetical protein [Candidatus Nitrosotalea sp.]